MRTVSEDIFKGKGGGAKEVYPYDEMSDGRPHLLVRGEDFAADIMAVSAVAAIRKGFQKRGLMVRGTVVSDDEVAIQVTGRI